VTLKGEVSYCTLLDGKYSLIYTLHHIRTMRGHVCPSRSRVASNLQTSALVSETVKGLPVVTVDDLQEFICCLSDCTLSNDLK